MKKLILLIALALPALLTAQQRDWANYGRYAEANAQLTTPPAVVFMGNSITDGCEWAELFNNRHVKNRGISGDRSGWLLDRLDPIVGGHPKKLFLMIGVGSSPYPRGMDCNKNERNAIRRTRVRRQQAA